MLDETGQAKLVIMSVEEYQRLLLHKLKKQVEDVENINREIIKAQLKEEAKPQTPVANGQRKFSAPPAPRMSDMREEVIDPSFDFEAPKAGANDF